MTLPSTHPHDLEGYASPQVEAEHIRQVRDQLHVRFDADTGPDAVDAAVDEAVSRYTDVRIEAFLPLLVERAARAHLSAAHRRAG
jgi:hypothetical protein